MQDPNFILLYVTDPQTSARFYAELLGKPAIEASPTFAMFPLSGGTMLGLWKRDTVEPAASGAPGAGELAFAIEGGRDAVMSHYADWQARGLTLLQAPSAMDFGFTFTAQDPDGHRLRVFAPEGK